MIFIKKISYFCQLVAKTEFFKANSLFKYKTKQNEKIITSRASDCCL